jgi:gliding motility-associated-like protein
MIKKLFHFTIFANLIVFSSQAQLVITPQSSALLLAQKLVGQGVSISNVAINADPRSVGFFNNLSGTSIGIDSGIVLTNGRAKTTGTAFGLDGNGTTISHNTDPFALSSLGSFADLDLIRLGDPDLDNLVNDPTLDATILEFDFIPTGDSIKFRYVFSSEEFLEFPCTGVNDVFAFFIQGPGYANNTNIALIPGSAAAVTIDNINTVPGCGVFPQFYVGNHTNTRFTHNGHTVVFTARALVQPCQTYHLKLAIADVGDGNYDSGVFIEAGSLSSNSITLSNITPIDAQGNNYLAEGCVSGKIRVKRPFATNQPLLVNLQYNGTALNGTDVQLLPSSVTIPANQTEIDIDVAALQDNTAEPIETLIVSAILPCNAGQASSATIQIRDYDRLAVAPGRHPDTAFICRNSAQPLTASVGYNTYTWSNASTLDNALIRTPVATPTTSVSKYICTAVLGTCTARDSLNLKWKAIPPASKLDVLCAAGSTGVITATAPVSAGWVNPVQYALNGSAFQSSGVFANLQQGIYSIKVRDANGCLDSISATINNLFAPITFTTIQQNPSCTVGATGSFTVTAQGGNAPYTYAIDGGLFQNSNILVAAAGTHVITVKDASGCIKQATEILTGVSNTISLIVTNPNPICEGDSVQLSIQSNANAFEWTPTASLTNANNINPVAFPNVTTKYYVKAIQGFCVKLDSLIVTVRPAPIPNAGPDETVCFKVGTELNGSGGATYIWQPIRYLSNSNVADPLVINPELNTVYTLSVVDANGCKSLKSDTVKLTVTPKVRIFAGNDSLVALGLPVQLNVIPIGNPGNLNYEWLNPYGLNFSNISNPIANLDRDFEYYVVGRTANNCEGFDTLRLRVFKGPDIYVPNVFTPNGDARNDVLRPICIGIKSLLYFRVFNRYGELVFETSTINKGWNGFYKGKLQDSGSFVWMVQGFDYNNKPIIKKGSVLLVH